MQVDRSVGHLLACHVMCVVCIMRLWQSDDLPTCKEPASGCMDDITLDIIVFSVIAFSCLVAAPSSPVGRSRFRHDM